MAQADVGIAIGAGTDVAVETAQIVLVNSKLTDVILAIDLARTIYRRIKWNFVWALGYNTLAIPVAAGILYPAVHAALPPYMAAIAMALSSISVLLSSLLLGRYKPPRFDKKYGRSRRQDTPALEQVNVNSQNINVVIKCESMLQNLPCSCLPDECACTDCKEHGTPEVFYPGCERNWGKKCRCDPCRCAVKGCGSVTDDGKMTSRGCDGCH